MGRVAVSISHEAEFAVAIAYGVQNRRRALPAARRTSRSDSASARRRLMRRFERLRGLARDVAAAKLSSAAGAAPPSAGRHRGERGATDA